MPSAAIFGLEGLQLNDWEKGFFTEVDPWGYILFARNVDNPDQVKKLTDELRHLSSRNSARSDVPILIDQEGGRVQRLSEPHWPTYPTARKLGDFADQDLERAKRAVWLMSRLHAVDLGKVGINVDCLPLLDVPSADAHDIIGSRAYGVSAQRVSDLGQAACEGLLDGGVLPVIKHIPGHGRAKADSHLELPSVSTSKTQLEEVDFAAFIPLKNQALAMTAHVVFEALDPHAPATTSKKMIDEVIRTHIGFDGLLMSDDLSMSALSGDFEQRTRACFAAGCDVVLHCNSSSQEMQAVSKQLPELSSKSLERAQKAMNCLVKPSDLDEAELREEFKELVAA